jgi:hypothetical protein
LSRSGRSLRFEFRSGTTRVWCERTVLEATPWALGLDSAVAMIPGTSPESKESGGVARPGKAVVTSSDALGSVRHRI